VTWWRKNQNHLTAHCVAEENDIAEDTEWWLTLISLHEHFKFVEEALQGKSLLVEGQLEQFEQLLKEATNLHAIKKRVGIDPAAAVRSPRQIPSRTLTAFRTTQFRTLAEGLRQSPLASAGK
jgi:hypothetical protein